MSLKVYFPYGNPRGTKILVAAELANVKIQHIDITYDSLKKEEHTKKHPLGKVPVLETPNGYLFESNAILRYVARLNKDSKLYGENSYQEAQVDQWLDFISTEVEPVLFTLIMPVFGHQAVEVQGNQKAHNDLIARFKVLDNHFKGNNYLVGTSLTIADIHTYLSVMEAFRYLLDETARKNLPNLVRWFGHIANLNIFLKHFGRPRNCKVAFPTLAAQEQQSVPKLDSKAPQAVPAKQQQKKQPKEQEPKKTVEKEEKKVEKEVVDEDDEKPAKKEVNPLDLLPPSKFDIDNWKRQFLAAKTPEQQLKEFEYFWQNFDAEGWSIWEVLYEKDASEGKVLIKMNNTMNGFLQRSNPHLRKYAFAIHGVYGDEPNFEIRGAWLWRGTNVPEEMLEHPSYELHKFNKLNQQNEADRKLYQEYWLNQTEDESKVKGLTARTLVYYR